MLRNGRNSNRSSTPPSQDIGRSNLKSLRISRGRKSGGQPGHEGSTLKMSEDPYQVIDHIPVLCSCCGADLQKEASEVSDRKQEVVILPVKARFIEHRSHGKRCPHCGTISKGPLPERLKGPIQYGSGVSALVSYLAVYQHIPFKRLSALLKDLFELPISEGTIDNLLDRTAQKAAPLYQMLQNKIQQSAVVGADETGCRVKNRKGWFFAWQNKTVTFISSSLSRGYETIEKLFPQGFPKAVYVSDCLSAQLKTPAMGHQLCLAHLLRELNNFEDALYCQWSKKMKHLLLDAIALKKQFTEKDYNEPPPQLAQLQFRLDSLLTVDYRKYHHRIGAFIKRLIKNRQGIFTFLHYENVPFDNNGSEQAIRNIKVKTKVSGQFRSEKGANRFAIMRSIIDTATKNARNVFQTLLTIETMPT